MTLEKPQPLNRLSFHCFMPTSVSLLTARLIWPTHSLQTNEHAQPWVKIVHTLTLNPHKCQTHSNTNLKISVNDMPGMKIIWGYGAHIMIVSHCNMYSPRARAISAEYSLVMSNGTCLLGVQHHDANRSPCSAYSNTVETSCVNECVMFSCKSVRYISHKSKVPDIIMH